MLIYLNKFIKNISKHNNKTCNKTDIIFSIVSQLDLNSNSKEEVLEE